MAAHFVRQACFVFTCRHRDRRSANWIVHSVTTGRAMCANPKNVAERRRIASHGGPLVFDLPAAAQSHQPARLADASGGIVPEWERRNRERADVRFAVERADDRVSGGKPMAARPFSRACVDRYGLAGTV
jgi:hypothetical protein